eukprot:Opistho-2@74734
MANIIAPPPEFQPPKAWEVDLGLLPDNWESLVDEDGMRFYIDHNTKTTSWIPPREAVLNWDDEQTLPYGWEMAVDEDGDPYFIDHNNRTTTRQDPRLAGYSRSPAPAMPSSLSAGGSGTTTKSLSPSASGARKASTVPMPLGGSAIPPPLQELQAQRAAANAPPPAPVVVQEEGDKVLRVAFDNGQTRSFRYGASTRAEDMRNIICEKLGIRISSHFGLVIQGEGGFAKWLPPHVTLVEAESGLPAGASWKYCFRGRYLPKQMADLVNRDDIAFDLLLNQVMADVSKGSFKEIDYTKAVELAGLHVNWWLQTNNKKLDMDVIIDEVGLDKFIATSVCSGMKPKEVGKAIKAAVKAIGKTSAQDSVTKYVALVCDLKEYGGKYYRVQVETGNSKVANRILISARYGIGKVSDDGQVTSMTSFDRIRAFDLKPVDAKKSIIDVALDGLSAIRITGETSDLEDMMVFINGYYQLFVTASASLLSPSAPPAPPSMIPGPPIPRAATISNPMGKGAPSAPPPPAIGGGGSGGGGGFGPGSAGFGAALSGVQLKKRPQSEQVGGKGGVAPGAIDLSMIANARKNMRQTGALEMKEDGATFEFKRVVLRSTTASQNKSTPKYESAHSLVGNYNKDRDQFETRVVDFAEAPKYRLRKTGIDLTKDRFEKTVDAPSPSRSRQVEAAPAPTP